MKQEEIFENIFNRLLREGLESDTSGKAVQLETAIVAVARGEKPKTHQAFAKFLVKNLARNLRLALPDKTAYKPQHQELSDFWKDNGGSDSTPKTDLVLGGNRISLKMGSGQFMSAQSGEATATFKAALEASNLRPLGTAKRIIDKLKELKTDVYYSMDVTEIRKQPGYKSGGTTKEQKALLQQEKFQEEVQNELTNFLDVEKNRKLKMEFVYEAMCGERKFGTGAVGHAEWLLTTIGKEGLYGSKKSSNKRSKKSKKSSLADLPKSEQESAVARAYDLKKITPSLAAQYANQVDIIVKFKSREKGEKRSMNDVIGLMIAESEKYKSLVSKKIKEEQEQIEETYNHLLQEGIFDSVDDMVSSVRSTISTSWSKIKDWAHNLWIQVSKKIESMYNAAVDYLMTIAKAGWDAFLDFLGFEMDVVANF